MACYYFPATAGELVFPEDFGKSVCKEFGQSLAFMTMGSRPVGPEGLRERPPLRSF